MIRALFALSAALLTFAAACSSANSDTPSKQSATAIAVTTSPAAATCSPVRAHASGDVDQTITSGGISRTYILHIPAGYDGQRPVPIVIALPGYGFGAKQMAEYSRFATVDAQFSPIVVTLDGAGVPQHWNWRKAVNEPDDVQFVSDLLARLATDLCTDPDRIFVAGFSDGAAMARILACDVPGRIAAIATVASPAVTCVAPVPMIAFHGTTDPLIPFEGGTVPPAIGGGGTFPPVRRSASEWARTVGCDALATISHPTAATELSTFVGCPLGDGDTLLFTSIGGGHTWPGSAPLPIQQFGATATDIDATALIWDFFVAHPLAH